MALLRDRFHLPEGIYFCGNSLGPQPKQLSDHMNRELAEWRDRGVEGWWKSDWLGYHRSAQHILGAVAGAKVGEIAIANALTINLHLLLTSFYRPDGKRKKIVMEAGAFPSDQHAIQSHLRLHGLDAEDFLIEVGPRPGASAIATVDIVDAIETAGDELALVLWSGVHYYTGQFFELEKIAAAGRGVGATVGLDLAHAIGNVPLRLHDWGVDFAVWCSYKYLNGGPGAPGGLFVHERHADRPELPRLAGWWGHRESDRFMMRKEFKPEYGAAGWQVSTVPVLGIAPLRASLPLIEEAGGIAALREESIKLTDVLYERISSNTPFRILTPPNNEERGAQLSIYLPGHRPDLEHQLSAAGLICDYRQDNLDGSGGGVLRLAPAPLYNTEEEIERAVNILVSL